MGGGYFEAKEAMLEDKRVSKKRLCTKLEGEFNEAAEKHALQIALFQERAAAAEA